MPFCRHLRRKDEVELRQPSIERCVRVAGWRFVEQTGFESKRAPARRWGRQRSSAHGGTKLGFEQLGGRSLQTVEFNETEDPAGNEEKTFLVANCGMQGPPGPNGQNSITGVYLVKKICWTGVDVPGQLAPAQPLPVHPPMCEISCNPNDFFLSSACGEGEVLGAQDHPTGYRCHAFTTTIVCGRRQVETLSRQRHRRKRYITNQKRDRP